VVDRDHELSRRTAEEHSRVLRWYGAALDYRRVRWFCATPALTRRVAELVDQERMGDVVAVESLASGVVRGVRG